MSKYQVQTTDGYEWFVESDHDTQADAAAKAARIRADIDADESPVFDVRVVELSPWDELRERAADDHAAHAGKLIKVRGAQVGDGSDIDWMEFPGGLWVRVRGTYDLSEHPRDHLADCYWHAEALPGQLRDGFHVSWVDGPTYYLDGRRETPSWAEVKDDTDPPATDDDLSEEQMRHDTHA